MRSLRRKSICIVAFVLLRVLAGLPCSAQVGEGRALQYFTPENVLRFADHLYAGGDYLRAAAEYERYLFLAQRPAGSDSIYYRAAKALSLGTDYERSEKLIREFPRLYPHSPINADITLCTAIMRFKQEDYMGSLRIAQGAETANAELRGVVIAMNYLHLGDLTSAKEEACRPSSLQVSPSEPGSKAMGPSLSRLCASIQGAEPLSFKNPVVAGALSTLCPGTGKIYCGRPYDGMYSLLVVGLTAALAYDGFKDNGIDSARGWILGTLGAGFYIGNIYGSVVAVELHTRDTYEGLLRKIEIEIALP